MICNIGQKWVKAVNSRLQVDRSHCLSKCSEMITLRQKNHLDGILVKIEIERYSNFKTGIKATYKINKGLAEEILVLFLDKSLLI